MLGFARMSKFVKITGGPFCGGTTIHPDFKEALKKYNF